MSVASALNLDRARIQVVLQLHWSGWLAQHPALGQVPDPSRLDSWLRTAAPEAADQVLLALSQLAATDGGDDSAAATVLAWVLLPAASSLAGRLATLDPDIDLHVAAHLWIEVRQFSWRTTRRVAANIAGRLKKALLAELAPLTLVPEQDIDYMVGGFAAEFDQSAAAMERLLAVLEVGLAEHIITEEDRLLLLDVIVAAGGDPNAPAGYSLLGDEVSNQVAGLWGISGRTVRRRAAAAIAALSGLHAFAFVA